MLILAGAGSGKTRCLTYRFAYLVRHLGVDPRRILAITFTNKAAREMRERVERIVGPTAERVLWVSTFHSTCARLLRQEGDRVGLPANFVIYDTADQTALMKDIIAELGWDEARWSTSVLLASIGRAKDELVGPEDFASKATDFRQERVAKAYEMYQEALRRNNAADFDDLIFKTVTLLREHPDVLGRLRERFEHVLVDEYQDTNHAQYALVNLLASEHRNLCVVGDDDQSIYAWRGADIRNVLEFEKDYRDAKVIRLEQNYRSTKTILAAANGVIANNERRKGKALWTNNEAGDPVVYYLADDGAEEADFVTGEIMGGHRGKGLPLRSFAILYRTHAQSRAFEDVLVRKAIPYQIIGGTRFYERKEIKDVLAYLRVAHNPNDEVALERALGVPKRSIGPVTLTRLRQAAEASAETGTEPAPEDVVARNCGLLDGIRAVVTGRVDPGGIGPKLKTDLGRFLALIDGLSERSASLPVTEMVREVAEGSGMLEALRRESTEEAKSRVENIQELATVAAGYAIQAEDASLRSFLENAALMADIDVMKEGDDGVVLMTVHNAKGLEFPHVFVVGLEQGLFPHSRSLEEPGGVEEERRLCYVAMTRAMRRLYLTHARQRTLYGYPSPAEPSVFLQEVPEETVFVASLAASRKMAGSRGVTPSAQVVRRSASGAAASATLSSGSRGAGASASGTQAPSSSRVGPASPARPAPVASSSLRFSPGDRIVHPRWGEGVIVGVSRSGVRPGHAGDVHLRIAFNDQGVQTIPATEVTRKKP